MSYQLKNVNLIYDIDKGAGTAALRNINLSLGEKGLVGILGPSGSGKSSLLYILAGLKCPTSGQVLYGNMDFRVSAPSILASLRRKEFGFIFQQHFLINYMTVLENVLVPINLNNKRTRDKAMTLLKKLGVDKFAGKYPYQLSGGQRQRVAIVRALINDPKVIFGDEPTAALDHESAGEVMALLSDYTGNTIVVIVTHDESILKNAGRIIRMWDGAISEVCTPSQEINQ